MELKVGASPTNLGMQSFQIVSLEFAGFWYTQGFGRKSSGFV